MNHSSLSQEASAFYPGPEKIDAWCEALRQTAQTRKVTAQILPDCPITPSFGNGPNTLENHFIRFDSPGRESFFGYWQPALCGPAPLLINLPGYGGYINLHPQLADQGFHILHISPQGYIAPGGIRQELAMEDGNWPVLHNTAMGLPGGYEDWLLDCLLAVRWAQERKDVLPGRLSFYGTSQGGGTALLLASILREQVRCACADLPFLTDIPGTGLRGDAYGILKTAYETVEHGEFWQRLGLFDTLSHSHRMTFPVMLTAGGADTVCPAHTIEELFRRLPGTRQYTLLAEQVHTHTRAGMTFFSAWMRLYA